MRRWPTRVWIVGGGLLALGGLLSVVGAVVFGVASPELGALLTVPGPLFEAAGLVTVSFGFRRPDVPGWSSRLLLATGIIVFVEFVLGLAGQVAASIPALLTTVLFIIATTALLICALAFYRALTGDGHPRWALLPAAVFGAIDYFLYVSGYGGQWWVLAILGALYVLAGVVFATTRLRSPAR